DPRPENEGAERPSEDVSEQVKRLARRIRELEQQVEEFVARRGDGLGGRAGQQVTAIVQAAEASVAEIRMQAGKEARETCERLIAEAQAEADRTRVEAQADAKKIRTEAHAAAATLREQAVAELHAEAERVCARLGEYLLGSARQAIDTVVGGGSASTAPKAALEIRAPRAELEEPVGADVEDAVDELQSAASVLEQSLRHLQEIGREQPEVE